MPKIRPRTSFGSSSWSAVWDGMATNAYSSPANTAITTTTAIRLMNGAIDGMAFSIGAAAGPKALETGLTIASATSVMPIATRPMSMTSRFGRPLPYELRKRMPTTAPRPAGPMMKKKFVRAEPQDVDREARTDGAEHADQAGAMPR